MFACVIVCFSVHMFACMFHVFVCVSTVPVFVCVSNFHISKFALLEP